MVIPTYGGGARLLTTLRSVLGSETGAVESLEVLVVDDGSPHPVAPLVEEYGQAAPFRIRTIRQDNAGPAAARNLGFRMAVGDLVLFLDDDVEIPPDLVARHALAHQQWRNSVVWGRCVLPSGATVVRDVLESLGGDPAEGTEEFLRVSHLASGQLSVERASFAERGAVYAETLRTPAAEEYELAHRLHREGIPVVFAPRIVALHHQALDIEAVCRQQYKHGLGCAEAACRYPDTLESTDLRQIIERCSAPPTTPRSLARRWVSSPAVRKGLLASAGALERRAPRSFLLRPVYRAAIGAHFVGGVRDGLRQFGFGPSGR